MVCSVRDIMLLATYFLVIKWFMSFPESFFGFSSQRTCQGSMLKTGVVLDKTHTCHYSREEIEFDVLDTLPWNHHILFCVYLAWLKLWSRLKESLLGYFVCPCQLFHSGQKKLSHHKTGKTVQFQKWCNRCLRMPLGKQSVSERMTAVGKRASGSCKQYRLILPRVSQWSGDLPGNE